jgi:hypothetical protein
MNISSTRNTSDDDEIAKSILSQCGQSLRSPCAFAGSRDQAMPAAYGETQKITIPPGVQKQRVNAERFMLHMNQHDLEG